VINTSPRLQPGSADWGFLEQPAEERDSDTEAATVSLCRSEGHALSTFTGKVLR